MRTPRCLRLLAASMLGLMPDTSGAQDLPPFVKVPAPGDSASGAAYSPVKLTKISDKANQITDDAEWWAGNELESPFLKVPKPARNEAGNLPAAIPPQVQGERVVTVSLEGGQPFAIYGRGFAEGARVLLFHPDLSAVTHALDFSDWFKPREHLFWVQVRGDIIYFSYGINGYSSALGGKTAYLAAVRLQDQALLWRSQPLVANAKNFVMIGDSIVSGYGFTAEDDFLFVINRFTGKTVTKIKVATGPDYLILKDGRLYVRCYNRDYVFKVAP